MAAASSRTDNGRLPLWAQVLSDLRRGLADGEFDHHFPGDLELMERYGVSRHTVREAIRPLQAEGRISRQRGRGTFVTAPARKDPVGTFDAYLHALWAAGSSPTGVVRHLGLRRDDSAEAMLGCVGAPVLSLERLWRREGAPVALELVWISSRAATPPLREGELEDLSTHELIGRRGIVPTTACERIHPCLPGSALRVALEIEPGDLAFEIDLLCRDGGKPVLWQRSVLRSDRAELVSSWGCGLSHISLQPSPREVPAFVSGSGAGENEATQTAEMAPA
jgi:GntR family transcriptional regulator